PPGAVLHLTLRLPEQRADGPVAARRLRMQPDPLGRNERDQDRRGPRDGRQRGPLETPCVLHGRGPPGRVCSSTAATARTASTSACCCAESGPARSRSQQAITPATSARSRASASASIAALSVGAHSRITSRPRAVACVTQLVPVLRCWMAESSRRRDPVWRGIVTTGGKLSPPRAPPPPPPRGRAA